MMALHARRSVTVLGLMYGLTTLAVHALAQEGPPPAHTSKENSTPPAKRVSDQQIALDLVASAAAAAGQFEPETRGLLLVLAGDAVSEMDPERGRSYYAAAFEATEKMVLAGGPNIRIGLQEGIVARLAGPDPDAALELLERMDKPHWSAYPGEDIRSRSAKLLVQSLLVRNAKGDIEKTLRVLSYLGSTGEYPYRAATELIHFFAQRNEDPRCAEIFSQAMDHFQKDAEFEDSATAFAEVISDTDKQVTPSLLTRAIRLVIASVKKAEENQAKEGKKTEQTLILASDRGQLRFSHRATYLAFRLLPLAMRLDPKLARELREQDAELQRLTDKQSSEVIQRWSSAARFLVQGKLNGERLQQVQQQEKATRTLGDIREIAQKEPDEAIARAREIDVPGWRSRALASVARSLADSDPNRANSLLHEAESLVEKIGDNRAKVEALAELADVWGDLKDTRRGSSLLASGFSVANGLFKEEERSGDESPLLLSSVSLLVRLARIQTKLDPDQAFKLAESISEPRAGTYIQLNVAKEVLLRRKH